MIRGMWALFAFTAVTALQHFLGVTWPIAAVGAAPVALTAALLVGLRPGGRTRPGLWTGLYLLVGGYAVLGAQVLSLSRPDRLTVGVMVLGVGYAAFVMGIIAGRGDSGQGR